VLHLALPPRLAPPNPVLTSPRRAPPHLTVLHLARLSLMAVAGEVGRADTRPPRPTRRRMSHPEAAPVARRSHPGASSPPPLMLGVLFSPAPPPCREVRRR
jgi:hypothetical protein